MRVIMPGLESDFRADTAEGTQRYGYELYRHLKGLKGISVEKRTYKDRLQYAAHMIFEDFSSADIIHIPNFRLLYPLRKGKAVTLVTAHDFQPLIAPEIDIKYDATIQNRMWFQLVKLGLKRMLTSDYLICNSTMTRQDAISLGFNKHKIFVANHGIDDRFRTKKDEKKKSKLFRVGYIGGFHARKNVLFAIEAFKIIQNENFVFELWGKPSFEYQHLVEAAKADKRIKFMGFAPERELIEIYDSFDVFVFPSLYEGEGLPILEAQARGLPVIIYKEAKIPKEIREHCLEVESTQQMALFLERLKANGYSEKERKKALYHAREITWEKLALKTFDVYKKIC